MPLYRTLAAVLLMGALVGCGGGAAPNAEAEAEPETEEMDLGGWWLLETRDEGGPGPWVAEGLAHAAEKDGNWWAAGVEFVRSGDTLSTVFPDATSIDRLEYTLTIASNDEMAGTVVTYDVSGSKTEDLRLTRTTAPTGEFAVTGTIQREPVDFVSSSCWARQRSDGPATLIDVVHVEPFRAGTELWIEMTGTVEPGTYEFMQPGFAYSPNAPSPTVIRADVAHGELEGSAFSGTITFTAFGPERIAGSFDLSLPVEFMEEPETISGAFDVENRVFFER